MPRLSSSAGAHRRTVARSRRFVGSDWRAGRAPNRSCEVGQQAGQVDARDAGCRRSGSSGRPGPPRAASCRSRLPARNRPAAVVGAGGVEHHRALAPGEAQQRLAAHLQHAGLGRAPLGGAIQRLPGPEAHAAHDTSSRLRSAPTRRHDAAAAAVVAVLAQVDALPGAQRQLARRAPGWSATARTGPPSRGRACRRAPRWCARSRGRSRGRPGCTSVPGRRARPDRRSRSAPARRWCAG